MARTIQISVSEDLLKLLDERAGRSGLDREAYVQALLSKDLGASALSQILAPFREPVAASGISDKELAQLFAEAREDAA